MSVFVVVVVVIVFLVAGFGVHSRLIVVSSDRASVGVLDPNSS